MARHSKNNTASSVFTYGERQRLKKSNEWGEINARIGTDSQKKFEQCNLCLKIVDDPLVCHKGHLFCKACIIENLFMQKQENKKKLKLQKEEIEKKEKLEKINSNIQNELENFKKFEEGIVETRDESAIDESINLRNDEIKRYKEIEELKERKKIISTVEKIEKIKNCFWVPEKTPDTKNNSMKEISDKLYCPVNYDHTIRLKELIRIKLLKHETKDKFICCLCQKELSFQKITASKNCGHVMCKKCYDEMCTKDKICGFCNEFIFSNDLIQLCESGSSFSEHNRVETNKLNPYFKY